MNTTEKQYILEKFEIFSIRENNRIVIFPDIPFWIAVTEQGYLALEAMKSTGNFKEVAQNVFGNTNEQTIQEIKTFFQPLLNSSILYQDTKKVLPKPLLKPNKITFLQTMQCNLRCRHCCVANMPVHELKSMSLETAKKNFKSLHNNNG